MLGKKDSRRTNPVAAATRAPCPGSDHPEDSAPPGQVTEEDHARHPRRHSRSALDVVDGFGEEEGNRHRAVHRLPEEAEEKEEEEENEEEANHLGHRGRPDCVGDGVDEVVEDSLEASVDDRVEEEKQALHPLRRLLRRRRV